MRILITGGAGFIGSHLAEALILKGHEVTIVDDLSTGKLENVPPHACFLRKDIRNITWQQEFDFIFHLAASVGVQRILDYPLESMSINVEGTKSILNFAARSRTPVFIASTSEVYGLRESTPFYEEDPLILGSPTKSRWSYAASKLMDEHLAMAYRQQGAVPVIIGRIFNTIGPRQSADYGMVVPRFIKQSLEGEPLTVYGDGTQTRCFCDVRDTVKAMILLMEAKCYGEIVNIGTDKEISILELARKIGGDIKLIPYSQLPSGFQDMQRRVPYLRKLQRLTGFTPQILLSDTLQFILDSEKQLA